MVRELVEDARDSCCESVEASDNAQTAFSPELGDDETQNGFGVCCVQELMEKIFAVGVVVLSGTWEGLGFAEVMKLFRSRTRPRKRSLSRLSLWMTGSMPHLRSCNAMRCGRWFSLCVALRQHRG